MASTTLTDHQVKTLSEFVGNINNLSHDLTIYLNPANGQLKDSDGTVLAILVLNVDGKTYDLVLGS